MKKILLVEDDQLLSSILTGSFRDAGFEVTCAFDGDSAVVQAIERHYDIMLLDILLPGKDGFEVLTAMKAMAATRDIPVIVISNLSDEKSIERMKQAGALSYIIKAQSTPHLLIEEVQKVFSHATS